ncbi:MAG: restriction endonuclease subunit S [Minwuia sp.]|uniref:restriction endonuclease subunit S n=1 Tax=Minwuia sp. TaxID=2493630 RepID=UPI003A8360A1
MTLHTPQRGTPASWDRRKIKFHLSAFFGGGTPSKDNLDYWTAGTIPWVTPKDMKRRMIDAAEDLITVDAVKNSATNMVPPSSVLMVVRSGILKHSLPVALNTVPVALNQDMKAFRFRRSLMPEFFAYWIEGQQKQKLLEWCQIGATVDNIDVDAMLNGQIAVPDLPTQRRIADFLDRETARIDLLIEKKQRLVVLLGEKVRSDIHDLFGSLDARTWRIRHLGKVRNGAGFPVDLQGDSSNEIPFFKVKHLAVNGLDQRIVDSGDTITKETAKSLRAIVFPEGTIIFAKIGAALLLCRFSMLGTEGCIDNNLAAFVVSKSSR